MGRTISFVRSYSIYRTINDILKYSSSLATPTRRSHSSPASHPATWFPLPKELRPRCVSTHGGDTALCTEITPVCSARSRTRTSLYSSRCLCRTMLRHPWTPQSPSGELRTIVWWKQPVITLLQTLSKLPFLDTLDMPEPCVNVWASDSRLLSGSKKESFSNRTLQARQMSSTFPI